VASFDRGRHLRSRATSGGALTTVAVMRGRPAIKPGQLFDVDMDQSPGRPTGLARTRRLGSGFFSSFQTQAFMSRPNGGEGRTERPGRFAGGSVQRWCRRSTACWSLLADRASAAGCGEHSVDSAVAATRLLENLESTVAVRRLIPACAQGLLSGSPSSRWPADEGRSRPDGVSRARGWLCMVCEGLGTVVTLRPLATSHSPFVSLNNVVGDYTSRWSIQNELACVGAAAQVSPPAPVMLPLRRSSLKQKYTLPGLRI